jgi:chromosome segregation ATPase
VETEQVETKAQPAESVKAQPVAQEQQKQTEQKIALVEQVANPTNEKSEKPEKSLEFFIKRIGELETEKKELNGVISSLKEAEESRSAEQARSEQKRRLEARQNVLESEYKILKPEYIALAPTLEEADPTTEEGKETLRQWVNSNPGLFGKAPELPTANEKPTKKPGLTKGWTWADKWRG